MQLPDLPKDKLFKYLKENKESLLSAKKAQTKYTDSFSHPAIMAKREVKTEGTKATSSDESSDVPEVELVVTPDSIDVTVVCNTAWFCDSQMDVLTGDCYTKSVNTKGTSIPHIADHKQSSTAHVGDVTAVYTKELTLKELGLPQSGSTTALVMETTIRKDYNEDVYKFYDNGKINQHSIGLRYVDIKMAIHSYEESDKEELAVWEEFYPQIINKDYVDARGYFWLVSEIDIIENSCVLFGANSLTPTLSAKSDINSFVATPEELKNSLEVQNAVKSNETEIQTVLTKGEYMNVEELQAEVIRLGAALEQAKAETSLVIAAATNKEQGRILGIVEAGKTFSTPLDASIKLIKSGTSVENAVTTFETIKEFSQVASTVDTTKNGLNSTLTEENTKFASNGESHPLMEIMKAMTAEVPTITATII